MATNTEFPNLTRVLNDYANSLVDNYRNALSTDGINASSELSNSVKYIIEKDNGKFEVNLELADYWKYVENGRRAGKMPPISAIEKWIEIKPVLPRPYNGKLPTTKQLAFLIARSIGENGIEPKHILGDRVDNLNTVFLNEIEKWTIFKIL